MHIPPAPGAVWDCSRPLSCGGSHLGHGGNGIGSRVLTGVARDGRRVLTVSAHSRSADAHTAARQEEALHGLVDRALCRTG